MKSREHFSAVGIPTIRSDGEPKVTGATRYTADYTLPGMIWRKCLRSPFSHARIRRIDFEQAKRINGVVAIARPRLRTDARPDDGQFDRA